MRWLMRLYGWPHERLHALALRLIGRRAHEIGAAHIDIPADLTTREFVFVAGLPALVFCGATGLGAVLLLDAATGPVTLAGLLLVIGGGPGVFGTLGDLHLIGERLFSEHFSDRDALQ